jgi:hypothetical protein
LSYENLTSSRYSPKKSAGEIPDKERRGFIHNAVRLAFPVLKTKAIRSEAVSAGIISGLLTSSR